MSDDILCCVENCNIDAEIEVERCGSTLWICADHYQIFIKSELKETKETLNCPFF